MSVDRSDPRVWGGELVQRQPSMRGYELEQEGPVDFGYELSVEGAGEEEAVYLGEIYTDTEQEISRTGSMFGRIWGAVTGGDDG